MKAYFDRTVPGFLVREPSFDAVACEVDERVVIFAEGVNSIVAGMVQLFDTLPAPEECAQASAEAYEAAVNALIEDFIYGANNTTRGLEASASSPSESPPVREAVLSKDV